MTDLLVVLEEFGLAPSGIEIYLHPEVVQKVHDTILDSYLNKRIHKSQGAVAEWLIRKFSQAQNNKVQWKMNYLVDSFVSSGCFLLYSDLRVVRGGRSFFRLLLTQADHAANTRWGKVFSLQQLRDQRRFLAFHFWFSSGFYLIVNFIPWPQLWLILWDWVS